MDKSAHRENRLVVSKVECGKKLGVFAMLNNMVFLFRMT